MATLLRRIERASWWERNRCGCTITARTARGTGICLTCGLSIPTVSTSPPNSDGAILSTCMEPDATASSCMAELQQLELAAGAWQQRVCGDHGGNRRGGRAPEAGTQRDAFFDAHVKAKRQIEGLLHGHHRASRGIAFGVARQVDAGAGDAGDRHAALGGARDRYLVAECIDGKSKNVEADRHIAGRGRRKGRG